MNEDELIIVALTGKIGEKLGRFTTVSSGLLIQSCSGFIGAKSDLLLKLKGIF